MNSKLSAVAVLVAAGNCVRCAGRQAYLAAVLSGDVQLWELNGATIRTGDPDLIRAGQILILPGGVG